LKNEGEKRKKKNSLSLNNAPPRHSGRARRRVLQRVQALALLVLSLDWLLVGEFEGGAAVSEEEEMMELQFSIGKKRFSSRRRRQ
jgi:hypothetical protein